MTYALIVDITPSRATIAMLASDEDDLHLTAAELHDAGVDGDCRIVVVGDDVAVGDRIYV